MTPPGPPPKPTALKILTGNPGKRPLPQNEPKPDPVENIKPPRELGKLARIEWRKVAPVLSSLGLLTEADLRLLTVYCSEVERYREAMAFLAEKGSTYVLRDKDGRVRHVAPFPQVSAARGAAENVRKIGAEFGLSPASRTRIDLKPGGLGPHGVAAFAMSRDREDDLEAARFDDSDKK